MPSIEDSCKEYLDRLATKGAPQETACDGFWEGANCLMEIINSLGDQGTEAGVAVLLDKVNQEIDDHFANQTLTRLREGSHVG